MLCRRHFSAHSDNENRVPIACRFSDVTLILGVFQVVYDLCCWGKKNHPSSDIQIQYILSCECVTMTSITLFSDSHSFEGESKGDHSSIDPMAKYASIPTPNVPPITQAEILQCIQQLLFKDLHLRSYALALQFLVESACKFPQVLPDLIKGDLTRALDFQCHAYFDQGYLSLSELEFGKIFLQNMIRMCHLIHKHARIQPYWVLVKQSMLLLFCRSLQICNPIYMGLFYSPRALSQVERLLKTYSFVTQFAPVKGSASIITLMNFLHVNKSTLEKLKYIPVKLAYVMLPSLKSTLAEALRAESTEFWLWPKMSREGAGTKHLPAFLCADGVPECSQYGSPLVGFKVSEGHSSEGSNPAMTGIQESIVHFTCMD